MQIEGHEQGNSIKDYRTSEGVCHPGQSLLEMEILTQKNSGSAQETYTLGRTKMQPQRQKPAPQTLPRPMSLIPSSTKSLEAVFLVPESAFTASYYMTGF